jgi:hypothetical protein
MPRCKCGIKVEKGKELKHIIEYHETNNKALKEIDKEMDEAKKFKKDFEKWHKNLFGTKYPL